MDVREPARTPTGCRKRRPARLPLRNRDPAPLRKKDPQPGAGELQRGQPRDLQPFALNAVTVIGNGLARLRRSLRARSSGLGHVPSRGILAAAVTGWRDLGAGPLARGVTVLAAGGNESAYFRNARLPLLRNLIDQRAACASAFSLPGATSFKQALAQGRALPFSAVAIKPDFFEAHQKLGTLLQAMGKYEEAAGILRRTIELRPGIAEVHLTLGTALAKLGRHEGARAAFRRAAELKPEARNSKIET